MEYYELSVIDSVVRSSVHETSRNTTVSPAKKSIYINLLLQRSTLKTIERANFNKSKVVMFDLFVVDLNG